MRIELWFVLCFAFVINLFVVVVFAQSYYSPDEYGSIGLQVRDGLCVVVSHCVFVFMCVQGALQS